ncbi:DUF5794 domain-containing protein [Halobacteria archaeon AArc-curdl1]|uniref:DUF5794 domain-containing protein n=1 Tax=Natronosalvus hydrolyticus TaxID=2979988 RepID=A0AAP3E925_9EURY|nr:DUF5794 domain-containing protein [Halobacteria archaeon AArc-curdl1]
MSTSQHPIALRLERLVGGDTRLLALVMALPLVDGIFVALILAGALDTTMGAIQVGLLIFGGSATLAVILAEMQGSVRHQVRVVLLVGIPLIVIAAIQAALAPAIGSVIDTVIFERFAALVILAIAAKTASATVGEYLPGPGVIIVLGLFASLDPSGAELALMEDPTLVANATLAAVIGVGFALSVAVSGPYLRTYMDINRFRFGSAVALGLLPLSIMGMAFGQAPLAALIVAAIFALDPDATADKSLPGVGSGTRTDGGTTDDELEALEELSENESATEATEPYEDADDDDEPYPSDDTTTTQGRAPWL